jgi:hypothetical protein
MNCNPVDGAGASDHEEDVAVVQTEQGASIKFNNSLFPSWQAAREKLVQLKSKAKPGSVWTRLCDVPDPSTHADAFKLECKACGASCQLGNTSKWHTKDHTIETCRSSRAKKTAVTASMPPLHLNHGKICFDVLSMCERATCIDRLCAVQSDPHCLTHRRS